MPQTGTIWNMLRRPLVAAALVAALMVAVIGLAILPHAPVAAQDPAGAAIDAATGDLSQRLAIDAAQIRSGRTEAVTWNDACLGAGAEGGACAQVLTDGFVVWLEVDSDAYRYHTDASGSVVWLTDGPIPAAFVDAAALPAGATPRGIPTLFSGFASVTEFLAALDAAGLPSALQEIAVSRDGIPVPSAGRIAADGTAIEVYPLDGPDAVAAVLDGFRGEGGVTFQPPANATLWGSVALLVILVNAPAAPALEADLRAILGDPALATIAGPLPPPFLPATGSGGLAASDSEAEQELAAWAVAVGVLAVLVACGYALDRRLRRARAGTG